MQHTPAGRLAGKVAIVTGAGSGMGRATSIRFALEGAAVCCADINFENAARTVNEIEADGRRAFAYQLDTAVEAECDALVASCTDSYGAVDTLVAAAGINLASQQTSEQRRAGPVSTLDIPMDLFRRLIEVNFYGVLFCNRAVGRWLRAASRPGSIINIASISAIQPSPGSAYAVSKSGVWMLTKSLAAELAPHGIRVNAIGPGYIETGMTAWMQEDEAAMRRAMARTPMARMGRAEEVAATALFLASDDSSYFTGEMLHPAGGIFHG